MSCFSPGAGRSVTVHLSSSLFEAFLAAAQSCLMSQRQFWALVLQLLEAGPDGLPDTVLPFQMRTAGVMANKILSLWTRHGEVTLIAKLTASTVIKRTL